MKKRWMTGLAVLALASIGHAYTWQYTEMGEQYDGGWSSNNWEVADPILSSGEDVRLYNYYTNGMGQTFSIDTSTNLTVAKIRLWSTRYYTTNDIAVEIYSHVTSPVTNSLASSNLVASFLIDPGTTPPNPDGLAGSVFEIALDDGEYFNLGPYTNYYLRVVPTEPGDTNQTDSVMIWDRTTYAIDGSSFVDPAGLNIQSSANRDFVFGLVTTNAAYEEPPPAPTNTPYIVFNPVADASIRANYNDSNYQGNLYVRQYGTSNNREFLSYVRFDLSTLAGPITNVTLKLEQVGGDSINNGRFTLLGLNNMPSNTPQDWVETELAPSVLGAEFFAPTNILSDGESPFYTNRVTDLDDNVSGITEEILSNANTLGQETVKVSGDALLDFVENARTNNAGLVTFIIDMTPPNYATMELASREHALEWAWPELQIYNIGGVITNVPPVDPAFDPTINGIIIAGGNITVSWDSDTNGTYRIESKSSLSDAAWAPVSAATNLSGGAGQSTSFPAGAGDAGFFRVYGE